MERLNEFDYRKFGVKDRWRVLETIDMLTSLEMEINGYFLEDNPHCKYDEISKIYCLYLTGIIQSGELIADEPARWKGIVDPRDENNIELLSTNFDKYDLFNCVVSKNKSEINIEKLQMIIDGRNILNAKITCNQNANDSESSFALTGLSDVNRSVDDSVPSVLNVDLQRYRFEKVGNSWTIQFEKVQLKGVKTLFGLDYIKLLLQNPNKKISVLDLQQVNGTILDGSDDGGLDDHSQESSTDNYMMEWDDLDAGKEVKGGANAWEVNDATAIASYKKTLAEIDEKLETARSSTSVNRSRIQRLENEKAAIEAVLLESNGRPKDPEIDKNRKKVAKAISEAITKIRKLEVLNEFHDKPISGHFLKCIRKGSNCSYNCKEEILPSWTF